MQEPVFTRGQLSFKYHGAPILMIIGKQDTIGDACHTGKKPGNSKKPGGDVNLCRRVDVLYKPT